MNRPPKCLVAFYSGEIKLLKALSFRWLGIIWRQRIEVGIVCRKSVICSDIKGYAIDQTVSQQTIIGP